MSMGDITITSAKGKFNPDIDLGNLGNIKINDVPDFLTGDDVNVNLHNPVIELEINSDIAVTGKVSHASASASTGKVWTLQSTTKL